MNNNNATDFLDLINSMIEDKLSKMDQVDICQIVSNDNGTNRYNIKLISDGDTVIHDVINCSKFSFSAGDYAYILKIKNQLNNAIIIGANNPN